MIELPMDEVLPLYDAMAEHYHLIFQDWEASMRRQGGIIASLLPPPTSVGPVLDCACGISTQCLALAERGFQIDASDLSFRSRRKTADYVIVDEGALAKDWELNRLAERLDALAAQSMVDLATIALCRGFLARDSRMSGISKEMSETDRFDPTHFES